MDKISSVPIASTVLGLVILLFGRKLFWLCVAAIGFAAGIELAPLVVHEPTSLLALSFALILGFLGALLAIFLQKIAIAIFGFVAGGKLANALAAAFFAQHAVHSGVIFLIGGIVGALLLLSLFDWALIFLSSVVGAYLIQSAIALPPSGTAILFVVLVVVGMLVQAATFSRAGRNTTA
ncbi:MAG: hypothetical protein QOG48_1039 [Verrucomicrobiota bacterium]|jgi:hypothetical protein